jgi:1-deoxy-D-xylulose 5-phosphate reductoisomerase
LAENIGFNDISSLAQDVLDSLAATSSAATDLASIQNLDALARKAAEEWQKPALVSVGTK